MWNTNKIKLEHSMHDLGLTDDNDKNSKVIGGWVIFTFIELDRLQKYGELD